MLSRPFLQNLIYKTRTKMKKLLMGIAVMGSLALLSACDGKKLSNIITNTDSTAVDSSQTEATAADIHTEEAIKQQVQAYYDELNKMADGGDFNMNSLDSLACTQDLLELMQKVSEKSEEAFEQGSDMYFEDEGHRWLQGIGVPMTVQFDDITDPTQEYVEVFLTLTWDGEQGQVRLRLKVEDGQWKINDFADYDTDGVGFRRDMEFFLGIDNGDIAG